MQGLPKPHSLRAIYPTDQEAEDAIRIQLSSNDAPTPEIPGERPVISAIQNLSSQANVTADFVQKIEDALNDPLFTHQAWERIFQRLQIDQARQSTEYLDKHVRLYCLYALILPTKLTEFLDWLASASGNQRSNAYTYIQQISQEIKQRFDSNEIQRNNHQSEWAVQKQACKGIIEVIAKNNRNNSIRVLQSPKLVSLYTVLSISQSYKNRFILILFKFNRTNQVTKWLLTEENGFMDSGLLAVSAVFV